MVCWLVSLAGQVLSYRRSSGERRQQLKWLMGGSAVGFVGVVPTLTSSGGTPAAGPVAVAGFLAIPLCIGVAVLAAGGTLNRVRRNRARYGIDGGYIGIPYFLFVEAGLLAGERWARRRGKRLASSLAKTGIMAMLAVAAGYFYSTGPGKLSVWKELLDNLDLRGDEHVLDIGCGRGAVIISAAHRLPRGRATGVDIWRLRDQTGNTRAAAERDAMLEGVSERVEFAEADARDLLFPPESFDVVLSNLTFSNIHGSPERARALGEAVRVLRPGGPIRVVDDRADRYAPILQSAGCVDVEVHRLDWRTWFGLPGHHLTLVSAKKAAIDGPIQN